jgi:hypothetical protein
VPTNAQVVVVGTAHPTKTKQSNYAIDGIESMHRRPVILGLLLSAALTAARTANADGEAASFHFGVMGEVSQPGTYELNVPAVDLTSLLRLTGGLTSQANAQLRVIRNGDVAHQMLLSPHLRFTLLAGDLLVVGRDPYRAEDIVRVGVNASAGGDSSLAGAARQLAIVGLVNRPVVLKVLAEAANVATIVASLGQDPQVAASVRVVAPDGEREFETSGALPDGSVLVFDPAVVDADLIPQLPEPVRYALAEVVAGEGLREPVRSAEFDDVEDRATDSQAEPPGIARVTSPLSVVELPPPPEALDLPEHLLDEPAELEAVHDSVPPPLEAASQNSPHSDVVVATGGVASSLIDALPEQLGANLVYIVGGMAILSACSLLWSMARTAAAQPTQPQSRQRPSLLDALIHNTLPLEEEPVRLAAGMTFFGKPLGPQSLRVDVAEGLQGPHARPSAEMLGPKTDLRPAMHAVAGQPQDMPSSRAEVPPQTSAMHLRADAGHASAPRPAAARAAGVLDRALSSVQGADRS